MDMVNDKQEEADSLSYNTSHTQQLIVPNFKILGAVVPEKSLTLSLCITLEWRDGKMEIEGKNFSQHLGFLSHDILGHSQGVYKIWRFGLS